MLKLAILVKRNPSLSFDEFKTHLSTRHASLVRACPASETYIKRYVQSFTRPEEHTSHDGSTVQFDALVELWFENHTQMETFYNDEDYVRDVKPDEPNFADIANCMFMITEENVVISGS